uniref:Uncharacterized protein n=1 Tax=Vespula pensylvanica TaxID=30213 RepID=A0A834JKA5_VESPE|nr:hypothetical protein H0235_018089 [Vespula pensylvanica]
MSAVLIVTEQFLIPMATFLRPLSKEDEDEDEKEGKEDDEEEEEEEEEEERKDEGRNEDWTELTLNLLKF